MKYFWTEEERRAAGTSCCIEFQKGEYCELHWLPDSICIYDDTFENIGLVDIFYSALAKFDHYGLGEMRQDEWRRVFESAREKGSAVYEAICELAEWIGDFYENGTVITVCGI